MKRLLYLILALPLLTGCYEDKSSTKYDPIGSLTISGIEDEYSVIAMINPLTITPTVTSTDPGDNPAQFEYRWLLYPSSSSSNTPPVPDTLAQGVGAKDINCDIALSPGKYTVQLRALNPKTGYAVYKTASVTVNTAFSTGYYFLKETADGNTELDFMNPAGDMAQDLLESLLGAPISGAPTRLGYFVDYSYMDDETGEYVYCKALMPMGGNDLRLLKVEDMSLIYDHTTLFYGEEPDEKPLMCFNDLASRPTYISSKGLYASKQMPGPWYQMYGTGKFGLEIAPAGGVSFSPNCIVSTGSFTTMFNFFDEKNGNLVYINYNSAIQTMSNDNGLDYSPKGITNTLLFMGTNSWAIFQDKANPQTRYLYKLTLSSGRNPITAKTTIDPALNFGKAQVYGSNKSGNTGYLYAGVGDKLYRYDTAFDATVYPTGSPEALMSPNGIGSGEQITMITHKTNAPSTYLMIGTYKDGKYKVYMYTLSGGVPSGAAVLVASGTGKVVDVQYTSPSLSSNYNVNY